MAKAKVAAANEAPEEIELPELEVAEDDGPESAVVAPDDNVKGGEPSDEESETSTVRKGQEEVVEKTASGVEEQELPVPNSWSSVGKAEWAKLPKAAQAEITKREKEIHQGIEQYRDRANFADQVNSAINPYLPIIRAVGSNPVAAIQELLQTAYQLRQDPHGTLLRLAQVHNVDLPSLAARMGGSADHEQQGQVDPLVRRILERQDALEANLNGFHQRALTDESSKAEQDLMAFHADAKNEFFSDPHVRNTMGQLLKSGMVGDLKSAYDQAVYLVPHIRTQVLARQTEQSLNASHEKARRKAADARRAAVDVVDDAGSESLFPEESDDLSVTLRKNYRLSIAGRL